MSKTFTWIALLACCGVTLAVACGNEPDGATEGNGAGGARAGKLPGKLRTEDGYEVVLANPRKFAQQQQARSKQGDRAAQRARENLVMEPTSPDPAGGRFTLEMAVAGLPVDGTLVAEIRTDLGTFFCDLFADKTPNLVANFIGLARGTRPWWDARAGQWVRRPAYDGTTFHRVIPEYLIQGGDYLGDGTGRVGYTVPDERVPELRHDRAGLLSMASTGPNQNGAQFFITDGPRPDLDRTSQYPIFGECQPVTLVARIARVPQEANEDNRPLTPVAISRVLIRRVVGGADAARPTPPVLPEGEQQEPRGATPNPSAPHRDPLPPSPHPRAPMPRERAPGTR